VNTKKLSYNSESESSNYKILQKLGIYGFASKEGEKISIHKSANEVSEILKNSIKKHEVPCYI